MPLLPEFEEIAADPGYIEMSHAEAECGEDMEWVTEDAPTHLGHFFVKRTHGDDKLRTLVGLESVTWIRKLGIGVGTYPRGSDLQDVEGLQNVAWIAENLSVGDSPALASLEGLRGLRGIGGNLIVACCDALTEMAGLSSLRLVQGDIKIRNNAELTRLGLDALEWVEGDTITIKDNPKLPVAEVEAFVERMHASGFRGGFTITGNLGEPAGEGHRDTPPIDPADNLTVLRWDQRPSEVTLKTDRNAAHWPFGDDAAEVMHSLNAVYTEEFIRQARVLCEEHAKTLPDAEREDWLAAQEERLASYRKGS